MEMWKSIFGKETSQIPAERIALCPHYDNQTILVVGSRGAGKTALMLKAAGERYSEHSTHFIHNCKLSCVYEGCGADMSLIEIANELSNEDSEYVSYLGNITNYARTLSEVNGVLIVVNASVPPDNTTLQLIKGFNNYESLDGFHPKGIKIAVCLNKTDLSSVITLKDAKNQLHLSNLNQYDWEIFSSNLTQPKGFMEAKAG